MGHGMKSISVSYTHLDVYKRQPYNKEYELKEGKYPEKMQEIAAGRAFFRAMGYDCLLYTSRSV